MTSPVPCFRSSYICYKELNLVKTSNMMDIQAEKLQLIEWLTKLNSPSKLKPFIALKKEQEKDWWDQISQEEKDEIKEGLAQADGGEVVPHKQVMSKYKKWFSK